MNEYSGKNDINNVVYSHQNTVVQTHPTTNASGKLTIKNLDHDTLDVAESHGLGYLVFYFYYMECVKNPGLDKNGYITKTRKEKLITNKRYGSAKKFECIKLEILLYVIKQICQSNTLIGSKTLDLDSIDILKISNILFIEFNVN